MTEFEEYLKGTFEINNGIENDVDNLVRIHAPELLKLAKKELMKEASDDFESEWKRYCDSKGGSAVTMNVKEVAKHFAQWQKEQDFNDFARLRRSWYEEGRIDGKFEGLSDDVKYQQGFHDAKEQMMKDAVEGELDCDDNGSWCSFDSNIVPISQAGNKVKVIIIK